MCGLCDERRGVPPDTGCQDAAAKMRAAIGRSRLAGLGGQVAHVKLGDPRNAAARQEESALRARLIAGFAADQADTANRAIGAHELTNEAGITYRQLDFWTRAGYLHAMPGTGQGTGSSRRFAPDEVEVCCRMAALVNIDIAVPAASQIARQWEAAGGISHRLSGRFVLVDSLPPMGEDDVRDPWFPDGLWAVEG
jgi:hypothetical protein